MLNEYIHLCLPTPTSQLRSGTNCVRKISLGFFMIPKGSYPPEALVLRNSDWVYTIPVLPFTLFPFELRNDGSMIL